MKSFYFVFKNHLANINYIDAVSLPYDSSHDLYPDDKDVANAIANYALAFNACATIINQFTYDRLLSKHGDVIYHKKIAVNDQIYYIISPIKEQSIVMINGKPKHRRSKSCPVYQIKQLGIPCYIPKK